ncbi:MAG: hypothetical protein LC110_02065 [Burkholderiales bacterium]|nr:hypothetical protein [Burkholderiales bacterium]
MATLRVRFKLNPGRTGIALGKLSKQAESIELFLRALASDLGEDDAPSLWLAKDFKNGSVYNTAEYQAVVETDMAAKFNDAVHSLTKFQAVSRVKLPEFVTPTTIDRFASLRQGLDADEELGIALFDVETGKLRRWAYVDRLQLEKIGQSIETDIRYIGAVMGRTHEWNKGAKEPYLIVRELNSGELIKCVYADEDYSKVARLFSDKSAIVIIEGSMTFNRITGKTEVTMATGFELAPEFSDQDYEKFFGCAPDFTGALSTAQFIARGRDDD